MNRTTAEDRAAIWGQQAKALILAGLPDAASLAARTAASYGLTHIEWAASKWFRS